ncbi:hypothetical protein OG956_04830 [Streptomyces sp. NBC_00557]|nr:hypothetical protein [Streptomyces sp. NBC_00557]WUC33578.1 hypothetical protein OG956_04830 [Streptomyces sp. NBC_00557]
MPQRTLLLVLFDGVQSLDVTGPLEVFTGAEKHTPGSYRIRTAWPPPDSWTGAARPRTGWRSSS